jgi:hypothetical protein
MVQPSDCSRVPLLGQRIRDVWQSLEEGAVYEFTDKARGEILRLAPTG